MIRTITPKDASDMAELIRQLSPTDLCVDQEMVAALKAKLTSLTRLEHMRVFGFEQNGKVVGTCTLGRVEGLSKGCRPFAVIENVVVLDICRGQGIGRQLVRHAIDQAKRWGCYKVILETGTQEEWKLKFYDSCGLSRGGKTAFMKRF